MQYSPFIPFDSWDKAFKQPFGAVRTGEKIHFSVKLPRSIGCSSCKLFINRDGGYTEERFDMFWRGLDSDPAFEWWECHHAPLQAGLYWYRFDLTVNSGFMTVSHLTGGQGILGDRLECWQLTVYEQDFQTPDWLKGGIIYQIFPDRFCFSGTAKEDVPDDRIIHADWNETPFWKPNEAGKILNNDYFGGDFKGIEQKLPYLKSLGVSCIYLNPIFEAHSNHRYNTANYENTDPLLGKNEDFISLCKAADRMDIKIMLDGVFSHTGSDSVYFNREGRYGSGGAYNDDNSPYAKWYKFSENRDKYECWWGFVTLPDVDENRREYLEYITGEGGIAQKWLDMGASGWRLDVADELPDNFLEHFRESVKQHSPYAVIIGEVWEDASNKISYNQRRHFLSGRQLDSVMNYPFRRAIIDFLHNRSAEQFVCSIMSICENYPKPSLDTMMNLLGTHDTERILTALGGEPQGEHDRQWQSLTKMSGAELNKAKHELCLAAILQYTLPGVPSIYYGDETGMTGYSDPFNRGTYPWGNEDARLLKHYVMLGKIRSACKPLIDGEFVPYSVGKNAVCYLRVKDNEAVMTAVNLGDGAADIPIPRGYWVKSQMIPARLVDGIAVIKAQEGAILLLERAEDAKTPEQPA